MPPLTQHKTTLLILSLTVSFSLLYSCHKAEQVGSYCYEESEISLKRNTLGYIINHLNIHQDSIPCSSNIRISPELSIYAQTILNRLKATNYSTEYSENLELIINHPNCLISQLHNKSNFSILSGKDSTNNILYTAYYTPSIKASWSQSEKFSIPVYSTEQVLLYDTILVETGLDQDSTRFTIDSTSINSTLVYLESYYDRYKLFLQGSSEIEISNNEKYHLVFERGNKKRFRTLFDLVNSNEGLPSLMTNKLDYVNNYYLKNKEKLDSIWKNDDYNSYYQLKNKSINSALSIALLAKHSIAVSKKHFPLGSIFLAEVPNIDTQGNIINYDFRILIAADVGSYIKTSHKFDLYLGKGLNAEKEAHLLNHHGRVWKF